ncbi:MAG: Zn-ribbon domain-containing OB-fold protein [Actinomycetota bacterium]|nr:Zn-ribbon domain-containing OB-fold protein [Actinomycetota bacterium]
MEERPFSDITFKEFLTEGKLMGSKCSGCGQLYVPPRHFCPECHGQDMEWFEFGGEGELAAFTCIFIGPPHMVREGYDRKHPYCTGVVKLAEGPRIVARIEGVDASDPESVKVGLPLQMTFLERGEGEEAFTSLAFKSR